MNIIILNIYYFTIYSFMGWLIEVGYVFVKTGELSNRGFLTGPFCVMYGFGALLIIRLMEKHRESLIEVFLGSVLIAGGVEYFTSYILELGFNLSLWDYSHYRFDINGRVKLLNLIYFGLLSLALIEIIHPKVKNLINRASIKKLKLLAIPLLLYFILDMGLTLKAIEQMDSIGLSGKSELHNLNSSKQSLFESLLTKIK